MSIDSYTEVQVLDENGEIFPSSTAPDLSPETHTAIYKGMVRANLFNKKAEKLQRRGDISTYAQMDDHAASQVASAHAVGENDWIVPTYRENGALLTQLPMNYPIANLGGYEEGQKVPEDADVLPIAIPIATQIPHAVGISKAMNIKDDDAATLVYFGDGATSEGDFHEGMNMAGVFNTPTVFFCQNNQYAISTSFDQQTATDTIAEKAQAYGFDGVLVDGTDPLAVYQATQEAVQKAKNPDPGEMRPTLIESRFYRTSPHTTNDNPSNYREPEEAEPWNEIDSLDRYETFLHNEGLLTESGAEKIWNDADAEVETMIDTLESLEPTPQDMFQYVFAEETPQLRNQEAYLTEIQSNDRFPEDMGL